MDVSIAITHLERFKSLLLISFVLINEDIFFHPCFCFLSVYLIIYPFFRGTHIKILLSLWNTHAHVYTTSLVAESFDWHTCVYYLYTSVAYLALGGGGLTLSFFIVYIYHNVCIIKLYMRVYWTMLDIWNVLSLLLLYIWQLHSTMVIFNPLDTDDTINCSLSFHQSLCMR